MLRLPDSIAETLDRSLGDGAADQIALHFGEVAEGEAASLVLRDGLVYLGVRWYKHGRIWSEWWCADRSAGGELVIGGPVGEPA